MTTTAEEQVTIRRVHFGPLKDPLHGSKMSTKWADARPNPGPGRKLITTSHHVNLKSQSHMSTGGMVSYEDLLIAQYLDELRHSHGKKHSKESRDDKPSPYLQKMPHTDYTYKFRRRPMSATTVEQGTKPKIDAKFIADTSLWDPATPRTDEEGPEKYQPLPNFKSLRTRPSSAPVKKTKYPRPFSAASTASYYGAGRRPWSGVRPQSGKRIRSQYKKQPRTIRVTAFRNGSREPFIRLAAPSVKMLLEYCTDKLDLPFAARRIFLEEGVEVFEPRDIPADAEVYISMGENYKDPYASTKRNIILSNGAKWTLSGLMLPDEGKKKASKPRLSKRMKKLAGKTRVRIIVYLNGRCTEPMEIVADLDNLEEFLISCTTKLDLRSHARLLYDWEGNEITCLSDTPVLDECLQQGGGIVLGPVWVSTGEKFSPSGTRDFIVTIIELLKSRMKETKSFKRELTYMQNGETERVKLAIKILSMTKEEVDEAITFTENDLEQLTETHRRFSERLELLEDQAKAEEFEGTHYRMRHIAVMSKDKADRFVGPPGIKLRVHENGTVDQPHDFYFNIREALKGVDHDNNLLLRRLLDELSGNVLSGSSKNPKLNPIAKKIYNEFGREIVEVSSLKTDDEIWVSFGEPYISPFTYCLQVLFDQARGKSFLDTQLEQVVLREQLPADVITKEMEEYETWEASIGFPPTYDFEPCKSKEEKDHVLSLAAITELDQKGHFLQMIDKPSMVLYPEIMINQKSQQRGNKALWPASQAWVITKGGLILCKPFPQLCLAVSELRIQTNLTGKLMKVEGYVVTLQKRMVGNPHQMWTFNPDATISPRSYPDQYLTYLGKKFGEEDTRPEGLKPGNEVYLIVMEGLPKKEHSLQRFALKQEKMQNLGQWKFNEATNPDWNKQALSWPARADGSLNEDYDWPMEGSLLPNAPKLHKTDNKKGDMTGMAPLRLLVVKNGERDLSMALPVVGPNLTNYIRDISKQPGKNEKKNKRLKSQEEVTDNGTDAIELDVNLHCRDLTTRELEFSMFLDHCTSLLNLPFAARRMFDEKGNEHFSLKQLKRDQIVYVTCGEVWTDPRLSKMEQQRRFVLSQLSQDVAKMRQYAALRNPEKYVLEIDGSAAPNSAVTVNREWSREEAELIEQDRKSAMSSKSTVAEEDPLPITAHEVSHQRSEQRYNNLKWPWERLVNVNNSFEADPEAMKYTDREMYEKYKPKQAMKISQDQFQRFVYEDGYIAWAANRNLTLGVSEPEGRMVQVQLVKRRPDDIYQQWLMKENGEIRPRHNMQIVMTVSMPSNEPYAEDEEGRPLTFSGCKVTLQTRRTNQYGKAHQRWRYDAETGFIHAFYTDLPDKEITAANKADVCTYAIANTTKIDQPGYMAEVPVQTMTDKNSMGRIRVCTSCARAMRGRYKLTRLAPNTEFSCAMGNAKRLKLQQIGSFRVLNGKVDLSTHEYELSLQEWEQKLANLMEETSAKTISKEINVARTVQTCKVLAYKNGEGRLRPGEIVCGSSVEGILSQCTHRLGLNKAACRMYTEDGTLIVEMEDLIDWAVQNYRSLMADHLERLYQGKTEDQGEEERGEGEGEDSLTDDRPTQDNAEVDQKEADKAAKQREFLLSQVRMPTKETILRYPIEIWISSGKPFTAPEIVESKIENRKKKRAFRAAVSLELDMEKHVLRQMKGRRMDEMSPGELKGTKNTNKPVVVEGHWEEPTPEEQVKHDNVHKLQEHLAEVKHNQKEKKVITIVDTSRRLYRQPDMKRIMVYPNGESVERAVYIWGDSFDTLLLNATSRLNLWQAAKRFFTMEGNEIHDFDDIQKDELLCVSTGKPFKQSQGSKLDIEVKANWSRAHKQYGMTATDVTVNAPKNPKVNVDPFGPPELALPLTNVQQHQVAAPPAPIADRRPRPPSAKPPSKEAS